MSDLHGAGQNTPPVDRRSLRISVRLKGTLDHSDDTVLQGLKPEEFMLLKPEQLNPWRAPACFKGQVNMPGYFWVSQTKQLVFYESRLEMAALKQMDFEEDITYALAQPFHLAFVASGRRANHVPDFFIWRKGSRPLLVNVKPRKYMEKPHNQAAFAACRELAAHLRIESRVVCEPDPIYFANVRWLAGFRRQPYLFDEIAPALLRRLASGPMEFGVWVRMPFEEALVRPVAFHLLWNRFVEFDTSDLLTDRTLVKALPDLSRAA